MVRDGEVHEQARGASPRRASGLRRMLVSAAVLVPIIGCAPSPLPNPDEAAMRRALMALKTDLGQVGLLS